MRVAGPGPDSGPEGIKELLVGLDLVEEGTTGIALLDVETHLVGASSSQGEEFEDIRGWTWGFGLHRGHQASSAY